MDEYFCPNCDAILNDQYGFDPDGGTWTCKECGTLLMDDDVYDGDRYEGVAWFCDECGALLNKQSGFSDIYDSWTCTNCYHTNGTTEDDIFDSEEAYKESHYSSCSSYDDSDDEDDNDTEEVTFSESIEKLYATAAAIKAVTKAEEEAREAKRQAEIYEENRIKKEKRREWRRKHKKGILVTIVVLILAALATIGLYQYQKLIPIGYSSESLKGLHYSDVVQKLNDAGFQFVYTSEISDLPISREDEENLVTEVNLLSKDSFEENTKYPYDKAITVVYHTVELYCPPLTSEEAKGVNYLDVVTKFENIGFSNIVTNAEYDIITGWITDDGEVKSVSINDDQEYEVYDEFRLDAEVVVTYHTLVKNKPK